MKSSKLINIYIRHLWSNRFELFLSVNIKFYEIFGQNDYRPMPFLKILSFTRIVVLCRLFSSIFFYTKKSYSLQYSQGYKRSRITYFYATSLCRLPIRWNKIVNPVGSVGRRNQSFGPLCIGFSIIPICAVPNMIKSILFFSFCRYLSQSLSCFLSVKWLLKQFI